jgi:thymidylate synthase (FAD)
MRVVNPSACIEMVAPHDPLKAIECAGRTCYLSDATDLSSPEFVRQIISRGHLSVLEHVSMTVRFVVDRGVSHELVRHRLASYSQESTRYCNYSKGRFDSTVTFIRPLFWQEGSKEYGYWEQACRFAERAYLGLITRGASAQEARSVLPNSLKTALVVTANLREWRHIFELRTAPAAHPQMREVMQPLLVAAREAVPVVFDDVGVPPPRLAEWVSAGVASQWLNSNEMLELEATDKSLVRMNGSGEIERNAGGSWSIASGEWFNQSKFRVPPLGCSP